MKIPMTQMFLIPKSTSSQSFSQNDCEGCVVFIEIISTGMNLPILGGNVISLLCLSKCNMKKTRLKVISAEVNGLKNTRILSAVFIKMRRPIS